MRRAGGTRPDGTSVECRPFAPPAGPRSQKKTLQASEQERSHIRYAREHRTRRRKPFFDRALSRLVFIDETSTNTQLTKCRRYHTHEPFGGWKTQTFIAGLRCHSIVAPFIIDTPTNKVSFETYIETQLAP